MALTMDWAGLNEGNGMKRHRLFSGAILVSATLVAAGWGIYGRRTRERISSPEGIEDPGIAVGFSRVAGWPQMRLLRRYVARRAMALQAAGKAADLGCGPGDLVLLLAKEAPQLQVTGVDLSDEMLAEALRRADAADLGSRVQFKQGDAARIPFPDRSLDLVVSSLSLHHWSNPVLVLDEIARVLRPGGAFLVFDLRRDLAPPFYLLLWFATRVVVPAALRRANEPLDSRNAAYTPAEAAELAQRSILRGWRVSSGPLWLTIEGRAASEVA
jgi:ubiquinone/menaquinone biosynthesis C-methylase UbiE